MIFTQIKETLKQIGSQGAEHEALINYDFKILGLKESLMRLCFSPLANAFLIIWIIALNFNPFRFQFQLLGGSGALMAFLYTPQWSTGLIIGLIGSYFLRFNALLIGLVLYLVSQAEISTLLSITIIGGVFLGEILNRFKISVRLKSKTKKIYLWFTMLQVLSLAISFYLSINLYQLMSNAGYFSRTLFAYRFEFISCSLLIHYFVQLVVNGVWGHFYARQKQDPSVLNIFYSSSFTINKFNLSSALKQKIKEIANNRYQEIENLFNDKDLHSKWPPNVRKGIFLEKEFLEKMVK